MKSESRVGMAIALAFAGLVVSESAALAACPPPVPDECKTARELRGYNAGYATGKSLVNQIWATLGQDPNNFDTLKEQVVHTIPDVVTALPQGTQYVKCRAQGLLDGTSCQMGSVDPTIQCGFDGLDWGNISASIYCSLSKENGGLSDLVPWYVREPANLCGTSFQEWCEDTYDYVAWNDPFSTTHAPPVTYPIETDAACVPYTKAPFADVYKHSVYIDCSYDIPPQP